MLDNKGFDLWADGYDKSVGLSDESNTYPFAGYKKVLNRIYSRVLTAGAKTVLDIGFGTGVLTAKLYEQGCSIYGQDFSQRMTELAKQKMPAAALYCADFSQGLTDELRGQKYDAVIATYSLHHLTDVEQIDFIASLLPLLNESGRIYIGDVAFIDRAGLSACRNSCGDSWDEDEFYFVFDELSARFNNSSFTQLSHCAGLIEIAG